MSEIKLKGKSPLLLVAKRTVIHLTGGYSGLAIRGTKAISLQLRHHGTPIVSTVRTLVKDVVPWLVDTANQHEIARAAGNTLMHPKKYRKPRPSMRKVHR